MTDVRALDREFDYAVPEAWRHDGRAARLGVGTMVRVALRGRRVGGWVTVCDPIPAPTQGVPGPGLSSGRPTGSAAEGVEDRAPRLGLIFADGGPVEDRSRAMAPTADRPSRAANAGLQPLRKLVGMGPAADVMDLVGWAAWRWAGRRAVFATTASPPRVVGAPRPAPTPGVGPSAGPGATPGVGSTAEASDVWDAAFGQAVSVIRIPPAGDRGPLLKAALRRGDVLFVVPQRAEAVRLAGRLGTFGVPVALLPDDWATAAGGGVVVGTRGAVFGPAPRLGAVVVLDEHDEALVSEDSPTWSAREVAVERARRAGVPCLLVSPIPTLEACELAGGDVLAVPRHVEREGWPNIEVVDQRDAEVSRHGILTETLVARLRGADRAVCVLNRKGRARLLACSDCGELVVCDSCGAAVGEVEAPGEARLLGCSRCGERRPRVCSGCGATRLKVLRPGVGRLREHLEVLLGEPVAEVAGDSDTTIHGAVDGCRVVIGTEAALHRVPGADLVAFLDFDQELAAMRYRANEQAMALLARAGRLVGPRSGGGRILVQTRRCDHPVLTAARRADPELLSRHDRELRRALGLPPFGALAEVAKSAAPVFMERLGAPEGVEIAELAEQRWLIRAADRDRLLNLLADVPRPPGNLRLAVDPVRV